MNNRPSKFQKTLATITAAAVCAVASLSSSAQTASTSVVSPPVVNPSGGPAPGTPGTVTFTPATPTLPYGAGEVLKMYQGGINKDVILNYINNTALSYHLSADAIIYLQSLGMPQELTKAMILRDGQLQQQQMAMQPPYRQFNPQQPMPPPGSIPYGYGGQPAPQMAVPSSPAPDVSVIGSDYPAYYDAGYPYYGYPYYYSPIIVGGWGWGRGWGGYGGFHGGFGGFHGGVGGFHGGFAGGGFHGGGGGHGGGHR